MMPAPRYWILIATNNKMRRLHSASFAAHGANHGTPERGKRQNQLKRLK